MFRTMLGASAALAAAVLIAGTNPARAANADWTGNLVGQIQAQLKRHGYDMTFVGGHLNGETRDAIADWQRRHGEAETGEPSEALLQELNQSNEMVNPEPVHGAPAPAALASPPPVLIAPPPSPVVVVPPPPPVAVAPSPPPAAIVVPSPPPVLVTPPPPAIVAPQRSGDAAPPPPAGYRTVLSDDFESELIDPAKWRSLAGFWRGRDGELQSSVPVLLRQKPRGYTPITSTAERRLGISPAPVTNVAAIAASEPIGNAFRIAIQLRGQGIWPATINIGPYFGEDAGSGYRLVYDGDFDRPLKLLSSQGGRVETVAAAPSPSDFYDGRKHTVVWTRDSIGRMTVSVDGRDALAATDFSIARGFDGFSIVNAGGSWAVDSVAVQTPPNGPTPES